MAEGTEYLDTGHLVQFYSRDEELTERVAGYLAGALESGGAAVIIATPAHRQALKARLARAGIDLAEAARDGAYYALDASSTLRGLMPDGELDPDTFERVIGTVIENAGLGGRPVRAYGEMVSLLWDDGLVNVAVQLEELWNRMALRRPFSLLCSYPVASVLADGHADELAAVHRLHDPANGLRPGLAVTRGFTFGKDAPAAARHFAVDVARQLGAADLADDIALVVTELAANAVVHARTGFTVELSAAAQTLRVAVCDSRPLPPEADPASVLRAVPLHGLCAVDGLASRWGVEPLGRMGKSVWAELRR